MGIWSGYEFQYSDTPVKKAHAVVAVFAAVDCIESFAAEMPSVTQN